MDNMSVLLVSVGGSPEPVIYSIEKHQPQVVIYFCSRDSRQQVRAEIEPKLQHRLLDAATITTPDEQSLVVSVQELVRKLPQILADLRRGYDQLQADFTGGTKVMAAAVVLALADKGCRYSYVGGAGRDKKGLGEVLGGQEKILYSDNPWDVLGRETLNLFALYFNRCRFHSAADVARRAMLRTDELRPVFETLVQLAEAYERWDAFDHGAAGNLLARCLTPLKTLPFLGVGQDLTQCFAQAIEADVARVRKIKNDLFTMEGKAKQPSDGQALILDLLANAVRRAEREHKYDDAVARLYSAVEKIAKIRLFVDHGINNSKVSPEQVPEALREELFTGLDADGKGCFKFPLYRSFHLLEGLGDGLGQNYRNNEDDMRKVLDIRNSSLLAHGFATVSEESYLKLLQIALDFCGISRAQLPGFPELPES